MKIRHIILSCGLTLLTAVALTLHSQTTEQSTNEDESSSLIEKTIEKYEEFENIAVIPVEGEIVPSVFIFLKRAINEAKAQNADVIVFKINTFGGAVDTAYDIVQLITTTANEGIATIALVEDKAISAGTLIALSCQKLYMMPGTTIGDVAPITMGPDGVTMLGEKFQSPLRAKFRALAEQNDYPVKLVEAFVTPDIAIYEVTTSDGIRRHLNNKEYEDLTSAELDEIITRKTIVAKGELLTMNEREARELQFSRATVSSLTEIFGPSFDESKLSEFEVMLSEQIFAWMATHAGLFIFLALAGFYLESQNPGFGLFGTLAILVLGILVLGLFAVELATYGELAILIAGLILIALELFIFPGTLILGLTGASALLVSLILMLQDFTIPQTPFESDLLQTNLITVTLAFIGGTIVFFLSFIVLKNWRRTNPLVLNSTLPDNTDDFLKIDAGVRTKTNQAVRATIADTHTITSLKGAAGIVVKDLRPSGKVKIKSTIYDAISEGDYIQKGQRVSVVSHSRSSLIVTKD